jgi:hypothetical protein
MTVQIDEFTAHSVTVGFMPRVLKLLPRFSHSDSPFARPFTTFVRVERILEGSDGLLVVGVDLVTDQCLEVEIQSVEEVVRLWNCDEEFLGACVIQSHAESNKRLEEDLGCSKWPPGIGGENLFPRLVELP